jgi:uncharacterized membrane protein YdfJ with MMPL/SSD domain
MGDLMIFQQMGFGVAVALVIDATIVRAVLGNSNWFIHGGELLPRLRRFVQPLKLVGDRAR